MLAWVTNLATMVLPIQRFHMLRLAQRHVTIANQIVYTPIAMYMQHTKTCRASADPSFPMHDTESDLRWGWLGLACETIPITSYSWDKNPQVLSAFPYCKQQTAGVGPGNEEMCLFQYTKGLLSFRNVLATNVYFYACSTCLFSKCICMNLRQPETHCLCVCDQCLYVVHVCTQS